MESSIRHWSLAPIFIVNCFSVIQQTIKSEKIVKNPAVINAQNRKNSNDDIYKSFYEETSVCNFLLPCYVNYVMFCFALFYFVCLGCSGMVLL